MTGCPNDRLAGERAIACLRITWLPIDAARVAGDTVLSVHMRWTA
jgi:hypothetical protein